MSGFLALLDDVAAIAKLAAAQVDDIAAHATKAGGKSAGIVQSIVAIGRYRLGGQWAMILSGGISALAGASRCVRRSRSPVPWTRIG